MWSPTRIAVIDTRKINIAAGVRWFPVRDTKRGAIASPLSQRNVDRDGEQVREAVNTGRLHARIEHNPNFVARSHRHGFCPLRPKL